MGDGKQQTARKDGIYSLKDARKKVYTLGNRQLQNLGIQIRNFFAVELNKEEEEEIDLLTVLWRITPALSVKKSVKKTP